ncbi:MAG: dual specificity protein phosphatase [Planctomycetota bacterium]|nr:dual specificity protein phosphatase [Planctomycetota bacterium]
MDWINDEIFIGNRPDAHDLNLLEEYGIQGILSLDGSMVRKKAVEFGVKDLIGIKLIDGPGNDRRHLELAIMHLGRLLENGAPVLVHCRAGRSRSVAVVAAYLAQSGGISFEEALDKVRDSRDSSVAQALIEAFERILL